ncbi:6-pyruvoyl trahydropterin synthase family protein [Nocardia amamiensis]|uniref:6-pyruvoyl trahydropterin synthase family protein n=1 Tax=Nocardia amamiensis TaxID=404578 RepID=UPI00082B19BF|nr:6-carboxytetrahydropterin synthase [Nocardia amamiensis]
MKTTPDKTGRYTIAKAFTFSASHELHHLRPGHKCARNHGHNYTVTVRVSADRLDEFGFVTDFGDLAAFGGYLTEHFDHRLLNDVVPFPPTSELLAAHLGEWFIEHVEPTIHGRLVSVQVSETPTSFAVWERTTSDDA